MDIIKKLSGLSKSRSLLTSVILIALIGFLDYSNGKDLSLRILYMFPITIATWNAGLLWGIFISLISAASKIYFDYILGTAYSNMVFYAWEGLIVFGIFSMYVFILSKLRETLQTLAEKNSQLKEANQLKDEFLGIASHDLKNPLNNILNLGAIIEEEPEMPGYEIEQIGRHIKEISLQMFKIIDNLITSAAIDVLVFKLNNDEVDIVNIVGSIVSQYKLSAERKSISLHFESSFGKIIANTDGNLVTNIIDNLISNALKFSPPGKNVWVRIFDNSDRNSMVVIEVQDEGLGFTKEDKLSLFSRFSKLSAKPTGKESSTGLGLYIVKKYIDAMNGRITCISERGNGAKFVVEIPANLPQNQLKYMHTFHRKPL